MRPPGLEETSNFSVARNPGAILLCVRRLPDSSAPVPIHRAAGVSRTRFNCRRKVGDRRGIIKEKLNRRLPPSPFGRPWSIAYPPLAPTPRFAYIPRPMAKKTQAAPKSFEEALQELEKIVSDIE